MINNCLGERERERVRVNIKYKNREKYHTRGHECIIVARSQDAFEHAGYSRLVFIVYWLFCWLLYLYVKSCDFHIRSSVHECLLHY
jgi:hypothetical protein